MELRHVSGVETNSAQWQIRYGAPVVKLKTKPFFNHFLNNTLKYSKYLLRPRCLGRPASDQMLVGSNPA